MKKILITLTIIITTSIAAWAQPSLLIGDGVGNQGDEVCVDFEVRDFTLITAMYDVVFYWNPSELTFNQVANFNLAGLDMSNFVVDNAAGTLTLNWEMFNCETDPPGGGVTLDDGTVIFQLCFTALGNFGDVADINILGDPQPIIQRETDCTNIFSFRNTGHVFVGVSPVVFTADDITGNTGDIGVMRVTVEGFEDMISGQFTLVWDEEIAVIDNVIPGDVENLSIFNFNFGQPGVLTMSWSSIPNQPYSLPDGTVFFEIHYRFVGDCETDTKVLLGIEPTPLEFTNEAGGDQPIPTFFSGGQILVGSCDQNGLPLFADCGGPYQLNDVFCVPVTVGDNFQNISDMTFLMNWSSAILNYQGVQNINGSIIGFGDGSFNEVNTGNGFLGVNWARMVGGFPNESLSEGDILFEVCFEVVGLGGNSPVNFIQNGSNVQVADGPNIGIMPNNCEVVINQPNEVIMQVGSGEAATGDAFCVPITVTNFQNIIKYQFELDWTPELYAFSGVSNINIPGVTEADHFIPGDGTILFVWETDTPVSLDDGSTIFELCFTPLMGPGNCDMLAMPGSPDIGIIPPEAITSESNGNSVGIVSTPGELCTLYPEGFGITVEQASGNWNGNTCVGFTVASFDNITSASFTINWDVSALTYTGVNDLGVLSGLNFDESNVGVGALMVTWDDASGVAIPDDSEIFELCFDLVGPARDCYPITINNDQFAPEVSTTAGVGSLVINNGELCIDEYFYVTDTIITPVTCYNTCDGTITLEVLSSMGTTGLNYQWNNPAQFLPQATNLCEGEVSVTIYDNGTPRHSQDFTFVVPIVDNLPVADAGDDKSLPCNPPLVPIVGTGTQGDDFAYSWLKLPGSSIVSSSASGFADETGFYAFVVTNTTTGCSVQDTMQVVPSVLPTAVAGDDALFTCLSETVQLSGVGSTEGDTISYEWVVIDGAEAGITPGEEGNLSTSVTGPGIYSLNVTNNITGCTAHDEVTVDDFRDLPDATINFGAETVSLACDTIVSLNADSSVVVNPAVVEYQWFNILNEPLSVNSTVDVSTVGTYYLVVTNPISMCEASDTIQVIPNEDFPQITTLMDTVLTCDIDTIQLVTTIDAGGNDFTFSWTSLSGGPIISGTESDLSPLVNLPGLYQVEATNTSSNCTATAEINITMDTIAPMANAGLDTVITCTNNEIVLDGSASEQGADITYTWRNEAGEVIGSEMMMTISAGGVYCIEVKNSRTGCSSIDCVNVVSNDILPEIMVDNPNRFITCMADTLTLTPDEISPANEDYVYEWTAVLGTIIGTTDGDSIQVASDGVYRLKVTNPATGCFSESEFVVSTDILLPIVDAGDDTEVTCANETITIGGETTEVGDGITYQWTNIVDGALPAPNDTRMVEVSVPGTYELLVSNTNTGCSAADTIVVGEDKATPSIATSVGGMITCQEMCTEVTVAVDGITDFDVNWRGLNGEDVTNATEVTATVCAAGMYEVSVVSQANGCESLDTIEVMDNIEMTEIVVGDIDDYTCLTNTVTIDASGTGDVADFSSISWTTTSGNTIIPANGSLVVEVGGAGEYTLTIVRQDNGCSSEALISVNDATDVPIANAGDDLDIECGETGILDASASSQGADFTYEWSVLSGNGTLSGDLTSVTPSVTGEGVFQIMVTDNSNGCTATDEVATILQYPESAMTMDDVTICDDSLMIQANMPAGTNGVWSVETFISLESPIASSTIATGLATGANRFIWTLSTTGCPDYSSDTLMVTSVGNPIANNDVFALDEGVQTLVGSLTDNDIKPENWEITIVEAPDLGTIDSLVNGVLYYSIGSGVSGETEFKYMICSLDCPDKCDEGKVLITIPASNEFIETPNTITPNDDGINDVFFIDQIANKPAEDNPDNELIVFGRWGDVVYRAKPYNNDWNGTNQSGQDLPEGTYYYILRLNISEGDILRGNITIVK